LNSAAALVGLHLGFTVGADARILVDSTSASTFVPFFATPSTSYRAVGRLADLRLTSGGNASDLLFSRIGSKPGRWNIAGSLLDESSNDQETDDSDRWLSVLAADVQARSSSAAVLSERAATGGSIRRTVSPERIHFVLPPNRAFEVDEAATASAPQTAGEQGSEETKPAEPNARGVILRFLRAARVNKQ